MSGGPYMGLMNLVLYPGFMCCIWACWRDEEKFPMAKCPCGVTYGAPAVYVGGGGGGSGV